MQRRHFLQGLGASVLSARTVWPGMSSAAEAWQEIRLWDDDYTPGGGPSGDPVVSARGAWSRIRQPVLRILSPSRPNGRAVLIAAGGGYTRVEVGREAEPAARWLAARGYTAYVLIYRLPAEGWADGRLVPLQDALRALQKICQQETAVSVLGFSAGGHLLGLAAMRPAFLGPLTQTASDTADWPPVRGAALIYPVVSLLPPDIHTSTHRKMVGPHGGRDEEERWSLQTHVTPQAPPLFLVQAEDDPVVVPESSLLLSAAYQQVGAAVDMVRYPTGGHGFGLGRAQDATGNWPLAYERWLGQVSG